VPTPDETISRINAVMDDYSISPDAMRSRPRASSTLTLARDLYEAFTGPAPRRDTRAALAVAYMDRCAAGYLTAVRAVRDVERRGTDSPHHGDVTVPLVELWATITDGLAPLVEWAASPEGQAALAATPVPAPDPCHCLCPVAHPEQQACTGEATTTVHRSSPVVGEVDVPTCEGCASVTRVPEPV
jgi:hypothetical protein